MRNKKWELINVLLVNTVTDTQMFNKGRSACVFSLSKCN